MKEQNKQTNEIENLNQSIERLISKLEGVSQNDLRESFLIRDNQTGKELEFTSHHHTAQELANLGLSCWQSFFKNGEKDKNVLGVG